MRADVQMSTRFLTTQNAHQVGILTTLSGDAPPVRAPINVILVLDRSGSMTGQPLAAAINAACRFAGFLGANDRLGVVAFDDEVTVVHRPAQGGDASAQDAISRLQAGGSTNLSGGWLKAYELAKQGMVEGVNRIVLLTDGQANRGISDLEALTAMVRGGAESGVSTTCIGFGASFNEDLLQALGREGRGNYWYVERDDQMTGVFEGEIEGLVALAAQNVVVEVRLLHPRAAGVTFLQRYPVTHTADGGWSASLGDLYATSPLALGLIIHVDDVDALGVVPVAEVRCIADVVLPGAIEHRVITQQVHANLDGADHPEPVVERTFLLFASARAREEAIRLADQDNLEGAASALNIVAEQLSAHPGDPELAQEREDLLQESARLKEREFSAADRKYMAAMSMGVRERKEDYLERLRRSGRR